MYGEENTECQREENNGLLWPVTIEQQIAEGTVKATELVKIELAHVEDDLLAWAKEQEDLFIPIDADIQQALTTVVTEFPNLADHHRDRSGADPESGHDN